MYRQVALVSFLLLFSVTSVLRADGGSQTPTEPPSSSAGGGDLTQYPPSQPGSEIVTTTGKTAGIISQSPWFALSSGVASIIGLLIALYTTQVRTIPISLYRSLVWRKALMIAGGTGIAVFSLVHLAQLHSMILRVFEMLDFIADGYRIEMNFVFLYDYLPAFSWIVLAIFGCELARRGIRFDPIAQAREIIVREQGIIGKAREEQIDNLVRGRRIESLSLTDRRALRDAMEFYRYIQWRYADVVLGAPPPAFPLFRAETLHEVSEDDA